MAVQPEVQKKGFLRTILDAADDVFTRVTAGIPAREVRRMLRGEAPGRPNPRLKPHSEAFLLHIKPTYYHESVTTLYAHVPPRLALYLPVPGRDHHRSDPDDLVRPYPGARLHRHDPPAEQRAHRPDDARYAPPGRRVDGGSSHPAYGENLPHRQLQSAAPVYLVYRRHSAGADALPQLLGLPAAVGPAGLLGRDHRHLDGRSRAAAHRWRNGQPARPRCARHRRQWPHALLPAACALPAAGALPVLLCALLQGRALRHQPAVR